MTHTTRVISDRNDVIIDYIIMHVYYVIMTSPEMAHYYDVIMTSPDMF